MKRAGWWAICAGMALFLLLMGWENLGRAEEKIQAYFLNVGKADAILLRLDGRIIWWIRAARTAMTRWKTHCKCWEWSGCPAC